MVSLSISNQATALSVRQLAPIIPSRHPSSESGQSALKWVKPCEWITPFVRSRSSRLPSLCPCQGAAYQSQCGHLQYAPCVQNGSLACLVDMLLPCNMPETQRRGSRHLDASFSLSAVGTPGKEEDASKCLPFSSRGSREEPCEQASASICLLHTQQDRSVEQRAQNLISFQRDEAIDESLTDLEKNSFPAFNKLKTIRV